MNIVGLYQAMIGRFRQLSEPMLRKQTGIERDFLLSMGEKEKSQTPVKRNILVQ